MNKFPTLLLLIFSISAVAYAQTDSAAIQEQYIELLELNGDPETEQTDAEALLEQLEAFSSIPNLNALSYEQAIQKLHLNDYQYYNLQLYIESYGPLLTLHELTAIDGFTEDDRIRLAALCIVKPVPAKMQFFKNLLWQSKGDLLLRYSQVLERQAGYDTTRTSHYEGSPTHLCFRLTYSSQEKLFIRLAGKKDAGEIYTFNKRQYGFEFHAGSVSLKDIGILRAAIIGDFRANYGQGMIFGSSLLSGTSGNPRDLRRFSKGLQAVAPTNEGEFLRGGGVTLGNTQHQATAFAGQRFGTSTNVLGFNYQYRHALFSTSLRGGIYSQSDSTLPSLPERIRAIGTPTGFNIAADYHAILRHQLIFGEIACNERGAIGVLQSAIFTLTPITDLALSIRHYSTGFSAPFGKALGCDTHNTGESGIYLSFSHILSKRIQISLFADYYRLHRTSYRTNTPIDGAQIGFTLRHDINRSNTCTLQYNWKSRPENDDQILNASKILREHQRHKLRVQWSNSPYTFLKLKSEVDYVLNHYPMQKTHFHGVLIFQDIGLNWNKPNISLHCRIAYFNTDRYDERIYAYENDVYYAFTIGSYYYKGIRGYLVFRYKYKWFSCWLRFAQSYYIDRTTLGSGKTEIDKPHKSTITVQTLFRL